MSKQEARSFGVRELLIKPAGCKNIRDVIRRTLKNLAPEFPQLVGTQEADCICPTSLTMVHLGNMERCEIPDSLNLGTARGRQKLEGSIRNRDQGNTVHYIRPQTGSLLGNGRNAVGIVSSKKCMRTTDIDYTFLPATDCMDLPAETIALLYRYRWQIELFFRWFKCVLGCKHLLVISPNGVSIQVHCALIASMLITL